MTLAAQIAFGTGMLVFCTFAQLTVLGAAVLAIRGLGKRMEHQNQFTSGLCFLSIGLLAIVSGHTVQIWTWSAGFLALDLFDTFEANFYYATVTYTTLGYGDLVADIGHRVFAAFASITGLLSFGISTAFLIGLITRAFSIFEV